MRLRGVLFDLDGVLVESQAVWFEVMRAIARKFGYPEISAEQMERAWGQGIAEDVRTFYPGFTVEELEGEYGLMFRRYVQHLKVEPDGPPVLEELRARGTRVAVVTNSPSEIARAMLDQARVDPDVLVSGNDVCEPKPAPDGILAALTLLQLTAAQAMFVGDTNFDREAARRARIGFVGYRIDGDVRIESLSEVVRLVSRPPLLQGEE
ncbi:MAG TPA: HAD family hydrolase [Candidatus Binataceae bacterium]|nr:HAD family hydrolase [Candidatus Binataceae bacterium]